VATQGPISVSRGADNPQLDQVTLPVTLLSFSEIDPKSRRHTSIGGVNETDDLENRATHPKKTDLNIRAD
jgi:protein subunit release factor B